RGFVASIITRAENFVRDGEWLARSVPLESARLLGDADTAWGDVFDCPALDSLTRLDLSGNPFDYMIGLFLEGNPHLDRLRELNLSAAGLTGYEAVPLLHHLTRLTSLDLSRNRITHFDSAP